VLVERAAPRSSKLVARPLHLPRFQAEQGVVNVVGVTAQQGAGQTYDAARTGGQRSQSVALCGVSRELMNLVTDCIVKPPVHVAPNEFDGGHEVDFVGLALP